MRIRTLELTRYGKFTDAVFDFGEPERGQPDLHIIYGPNEAGKSTTFAAILDLLFGMKAQSPYNFLHPYPTMRISASLELLGELRRFTRIKKPQNSLLDRDERPLPEAAILTELGGMDRDSYEKMFFLDDATLEKGGEDILASEGELGKLLFSASAGLAGLSERLANLKADAEGFYRFRARSGRLGDLKTNLANLKVERDGLDLIASDHRVLVAQRDRLVDAYRQANAERADIQGRIDEIGRILLAIPSLVELRSLSEELAGLRQVRPVLAGWKEELPKLEKRTLELAGERRRLLENRERVTASLAEATIDPSVLELSARMPRLADMKARYMTAEEDIPKLRARTAETSVDALLIRLGRRGETDPASLILDAVLVGEFSELMEVRSGIEARTRSAEDELQKAQRALDRALSFANAEADDTDDIVRFEALSAAVSAHRNTSLDSRLSVTKRDLKQASEAIEDALKRLSPWTGTLDELLVDPFPDRLALSRLVSAHAESAKAIELANTEIPKVEGELRRLNGEEAALAQSLGTVANADVGESRATRESAWSAHRTSLTEETARAFETTMRIDDVVAAERSAKVAELQRLHVIRARASIVRADLETLSIDRQRECDRRDRIVAEISSRFTGWSSGAGWQMEPSGVADWLLFRDKALEARNRVKEAEAAALWVVKELDTVESDLGQLMMAAGLEVAVGDGLSGMLAAAEAAVEEFRQRSARREELRRLREDLEERQHQFEARTKDEKAWKSSWCRLCEACWIGGLATTPGTLAVKEIIAVSSELSKLLESRTALFDRIEKMEKDQENFRWEVSELCGLMNRSPGLPELEMARLIEHDIHEAERKVELAEKLNRELVELEEAMLELVGGERYVVDRAQQMIDHFGVSTLEDVYKAIELDERRASLTKNIADVEKRLVETMRAKSVDEATRLTEHAEREELLREEVGLKALLADQETRCHELFHQRSKAIDTLEAQGGDGMVAELEEKRRTLLLDIEDQARQYLALRAGTIAAEHALAAYRDQHRSSMMAKASEAFATISQGFYKGLAVQPSKDGETLIAIGKSGGAKTADQLSKGARFQLYLALRVAGYHEFVRSRSAVPFIADDIMETFDDFRAEEAFRLFGDMAELGQVIYMTHHRHLIAIAKEVCPSVRVHNLEDVAAAG
uniref:YhaN AAA domain-containing protein n=1 Tax=Agrobacterium albertimagni TaxID=147266 RepID=A0A7C1P6W8_9HYPH